MLERFRLERVLPWSGRSRFFEASDVRHPSRRVVVKTVDPDAPNAAWLLDRLRREVTLGARLGDTAGWVALHDFGEDVLVMELVEGAPLGDAVPLGGWSFGAARERLAALADAVAAAHAEGIAHGELTARKVLVGASGGVKLLDLGAGTVGMREAIAGDVEALGALIYLAMAGRPPPEPLDADDGPRTERPPDLKLVRPDAPSPVAELVLACMHRDPSRRPSSARDVRDALRAL